MRKVEFIPPVIGSLGTVTKHFEKWIEKLDLDFTTEALQKPYFLGTAKIMRKVSDNNNNNNNNSFSYLFLY